MSELLAALFVGGYAMFAALAVGTVLPRHRIARRRPRHAPLR